MIRTSSLALGLVVILLLTATGRASAQTTTQSSSGATGSASTAQAAQPDALPPGFDNEKKAPENPWRRFEIVSVGAFPISLFYVGFGFDLERYIGSNFDYNYAPWPLSTSTSITDTDRVVRIASAVGLSLVIGGIDAIIHAAKVRAAQRRAAAETIELDSARTGD